MESYVIRIYRRPKKDAEAIVGVLLKVPGREERPFKNITELCDLLLVPETAGHHKSDSETV